jgi:hypothetical protein
MQALATFISWTFLGVIISTQERTFTSQMAWTFEFSPPGYARADTIGHAPPLLRVLPCGAPWCRFCLSRGDPAPLRHRPTHRRCRPMPPLAQRTKRFITPIDSSKYLFDVADVLRAGNIVGTSSVKTEIEIQSNSEKQYVKGK